MRPALATLAWLCCSCTWGTYDPNDAGSAAQNGTMINASTGGNVLSDDGAFEAIFPANTLNVNAYVSISKSAGPTNGDFYSLEYQVNLQAAQGTMATAQLVHPILLVFHRNAANFNVPVNEVFIVFETQPTPQVLAGTFLSNGDVYGIQPFQSSSSTVGPYAFEHITNVIPASNACGGGSSVCGMCAMKCAGTFDTNAGPMNKACRAQSGTPNTAQCIRNCIDMGESNVCQ